jgi:hypothetical protein
VRPFPGDKARPGREADHLPPSNTEVENVELYLLSPKRLYGVWRDNLSFLAYCLSVRKRSQYTLASLAYDVKVSEKLPVLKTYFAHSDGQNVN